MPTVAVVYHSGFGHTRAVAESIVRGAAAVPGVAATLVSVADLPPPGPGRVLGGRWPELDAADAIVFGCPTYMGSVSAEFKRFMESSGSIWYRQGWRDKLAAGFTNAGGLSGDKVNALIDIAMFASQHSMIWVSQGLFYNREGINRMGSWIGMQAQSDDGPPDRTPPPEDHRTAELFGERVARAAVRWTRGAAEAGH
jgi:multimeric flavodoxin WrbA